MKRSILFLSLFLLLSADRIFSSEPFPKSPPELVIYTYDGFVAQGGLGPLLFPLFEKKEGCRVRAIAHGDGGQLLTRLELDSRRGKTIAHLVLGIDQHVWQRIKPWTEPWKGWLPAGFSQLKKEVQVEKGFLPYDYGFLSFIADRKALKTMGLEAPSSVSDLLRPAMKRTIILEDPRTSTPGLVFLLFTQAIFGKSVWDFWRAFQGQWLTLTPGWEGAYQLFLRNEAPLVWTYVTSQAYHEENGDGALKNRRYEAVLFKEGQPIQIEGAAIVKGALKTEGDGKLTKKFLEFLISPEAQAWVMKKAWMMPARRDIPLPESFKRLPQPTRMVPVLAQGKEIEDALAQWRRVTSQLTHPSGRGPSE